MEEKYMYRKEREREAKDERSSGRKSEWERERGCSRKREKLGEGS